MKRIIPYFTAVLLFSFVSCNKEPVTPVPEPGPDPHVLPDFGVYGYVKCNGKPVENVVVSDGFATTTTLKDGMYSLSSEKKNSYVFIEVPSGYTVKSNGIQPDFYRKLHSIIDVEQVDFELVEQPGQDHHTILFFGDFHLSNSSATKDLTQVNTFTNEINAYLKSHDDDVIYAITLGDMTWDYNWYTNAFMFKEYLSEMNSRISGLTFYHTIGNHDHDYVTNVDGSKDGWEAVDWDCANKYRNHMGPNNYAFNIGSVHYIILDNILCKNTTGHTVKDRFYEEKLATEAIDFLRADLKYVAEDTPIVIASHSPYYSQAGKSNVANLSQLELLLTPYSNVRLVTGHSHKLWNYRKGNVMEHNSGSICAAWWWGGSYNSTLNIAQDGSLGGYRIMDVDGKAMNSIFKTIGRSENYQFRSYDRNSIEITAAKFLPSASSTNKKTFDDYVAKYSDYGTVSSKNEVIINIWDWDEKWKLEITENGKQLTWSRSSGYDPLYFIAYVANRCKAGKEISYNPYKTNHLFKAVASSPDSVLEIKVTDDQGRVFTENMQRPKAFSIEQYK